MRKFYKLFVLLIIFSVFVSACGGTTSPKNTGSGVEETLAALSVQSTVDRAISLTTQAGGAGGDSSSGDAAGADGDSGGDVVPSDTPLPTDTPLPSDTPQPTSSPTSAVPMIGVSVDTNCRIGPGSVYKLLGAVTTGETTQIIAWDGVGIYYYVENPDAAGYCWLWAEYATVSGDISALPVFTPPPTPTPTYTPTPENLWHGGWNMLVSGSPYSVTLVQSGNSISGSFVAGANTVTLSGTVSADGKTVNGDYTVSGGGGIFGTFVWKLKNNINRFAGNGTPNGGATDEWCGYRAGSSAPSPCLGP